MRAHASQIKIVALCALLLALFTPALAGCGACGAYFSPPPHAALTVVHGVVYGVGETRFALRASDGRVLWQIAENPNYGPHGLIAGANPNWWPRVAPVVDGQTVIETIGVALFVALRASDGRILWHSQPLTGLVDSAGYGALDSPPVVADGVIYAAAGYGTIAAWDERDGRSLWVARVAPEVEIVPPTNPTLFAELPLPVVAGSTVYASAGSSVYALRAADGAVRWHLPHAPAGIGYSVPIVAANTVYVANSSGAVFALDAATGTIRWHAPPGSTSVSMDTMPTVVLQGQTIYVASRGSLVQALNVATGAQLWRYPTHDGDAFIGGPLAPLVVEGGRVYLASLRFGLYVLNAATGQELWRAPLDIGNFNSAGTQPYLSIPMVDQETRIVLLVAPNRVEAWRVADGQKLWVAHIPNNEDYALADSAAVAAGMVYVAQEGTQATCDFNGIHGIPPHVLALRGTDGTKRWQTSI